MVEMNFEGKITVIKTIDSKSESVDKHTKHIVVNRENGCKFNIEVEPCEGVGLKPGDVVAVKLTTPQQPLTTAKPRK